MIKNYRYHDTLIKKIKRDKNFAEDYFKKGRGRYLIDKNVAAFSTVIANLMEAGCELQVQWKNLEE